MHYYPHNIPDFNNATRHLTRVERSVYRDAIELYYDTESPLPASNFDRLCRVLLCVSDEERAALESVLSEFFELTDDGYVHARCELEIEKYRANTTAKARAGKASAEARKNKKEHVLNACSTDEQLTNNQELRTNNQELKDIALPVAKPKQNRGTRLPNDWKPSLEYFEAARTLNPNLTDVAINVIADGFRDYWVAKAGASATKTDWLATWRNWIRNQRPVSAGNSPPPGQYLTAREKTAQRNAEIFDINRARDF